jgi:hypothetical protein
MDKAMEIGARRVREMLEAHMAQPKGNVTEKVGKVAVTVDSKLQLVEVRLLDDSIDERVRRELEKAIVEAVNCARRHAVRGAAEALAELRESTDWKEAMDEMYKHGAAKPPADGSS